MARVLPCDDLGSVYGVQRTTQLFLFTAWPVSVHILCQRILQLGTLDSYLDCASYAMHHSWRVPRECTGPSNWLVMGSAIAEHPIPVAKV